MASLVVVLAMALANAGCASSSGFRAMLAKVPDGYRVVEVRERQGFEK